MKRMDKKNYSAQYPNQIQKWLNQCIICQSIGYKPAMPEKITPGMLAENIRSLYSPLAVNELSVCEECSKHMDKK